KKVWSVSVNPAPDNNDYYIIYGFGYSQYKHTSNGIFQNLKVFVPQKEKCKIQILHLENKLAKKKNLKIVYYMKPVLDEDEIKSNGYLELKYNSSTNVITLWNQAKPMKDRITAYIACSEKIASYTGSKMAFIGRGTIKNPEGI